MSSGWWPEPTKDFLEIYVSTSFQIVLIIALAVRPVIGIMKHSIVPEGPILVHKIN